VSGVTTGVFGSAVPHITETPLSPTPVRPTSAVQPGSVGLDLQLDVPVQLSSKTRPLIRASLHAIAAGFSRQRRRRHQQCPEESPRRKSGGPRGWGTDAPSHARWVPRSARSRAAPDSPPPAPGFPAPPPATAGKCVRIYPCPQHGQKTPCIACTKFMIGGKNRWL